MVRTQIQLYDEQTRWLKQYALQKGVSMAHIIREIIDDYRASEEMKHALDRRKKNALKVVGSFSSIPQK
jgi:predicted DNA-binding protein